jgi:KDO2-lipid IV(A) lauroyltransferase
MNIEQTSSNIGHRAAAGSQFDMQASAVGAPATETATLPQRPSRLYGSAAWRLGMFLGRTVPAGTLKWNAMSLASLYSRMSSRRREAVVQNLLPLCNDRPQAEAAAEQLFRQFARKLVDLWRFEAGTPVDHLFTDLIGWEHFLAAQKTGRGVLLVTPHLGNWEFGAPLLTRHGYKLHVITLVEPGNGLTELRQAARARHGIETMIIGRDPFAFVDIIRRLEKGATVALLIDRPPNSSAVQVDLFGRRFSASIAAAELARATNCEILPVALLQNGDGYAGHILPPVSYERATLRDRGARQQLTQRVMTALEPVIRAHAAQWYHFVPVWKES